MVANYLNYYGTINSQVVHINFQFSECFDEISLLLTNGNNDDPINSNLFF